MRGFILKQTNEEIVGGVDAGSTGITITYRDETCRLHFSSLIENGLLAYTWYASDLNMEDSLEICFDEVVHLSKIQQTTDYQNIEEMNKQSLEYYYHLKKELIEEGLIEEEE